MGPDGDYGVCYEQIPVESKSLNPLPITTVWTVYTDWHTPPKSAKGDSNDTSCERFFWISIFDSDALVSPSSSSSSSLSS